MIEKTAARADVRINVPRVRRILPPVAELIAVGVQNRIELQRLNDILPGASGGSGNIYAAKQIRVSFDLLNSRP
jgi:hypothetical protein